VGGVGGGGGGGGGAAACKLMRRVEWIKRITERAQMANACNILVSKTQEERTSITSEQMISYTNTVNLDFVFFIQVLLYSYEHCTAPAGFTNAGIILTS
jgi:hypothetical protein